MFVRRHRRPRAPLPYVVVAAVLPRLRRDGQEDRASWDAVGVIHSTGGRYRREKGTGDGGKGASGLAGRTKRKKICVMSTLFLSVVGPWLLFYTSFQLSAPPLESRLEHCRPDTREKHNEATMAEMCAKQRST